MFSCSEHLEEGRWPHLRLHHEAAVPCLIFIVELQRSFCPSACLPSAVKLRVCCWFAGAAAWLQRSPAWTGHGGRNGLGAIKEPLIAMGGFFHMPCFFVKRKSSMCVCEGGVSHFCCYPTKPAAEQRGFQEPPRQPASRRPGSRSPCPELNLPGSFSSSGERTPPPRCAI